MAVITTDNLNLCIRTCILHGSVLYRLTKEGGQRNTEAWEMTMLASWQKPLSYGKKRGQLRGGIQRQ